MWSPLKLDKSGFSLVSKAVALCEVLQTCGELHSMQAHVTVGVTEIAVQQQRKKLHATFDPNCSLDSVEFF